MSTLRRWHLFTNEMFCLYFDLKFLNLYDHDLLLSRYLYLTFQWECNLWCHLEFVWNDFLKYLLLCSKCKLSRASSAFYLHENMLFPCSFAVSLFYIQFPSPGAGSLKHPRPHSKNQIDQWPFFRRKQPMWLKTSCTHHEAVGAHKFHAGLHFRVACVIRNRIPFAVSIVLWRWCNPERMSSQTVGAKQGTSYQ